MALDICTEMLAYTEIRQRILNWQLLPGTRLLHRTLARELGTSATPVVLALRMLERDGLVVNTPGLGSYVRKWSLSDLVDLYKMRAMVEGSAARLCAERANNAQLLSITEANAAFEDIVGVRDPLALNRADAEFHGAIIAGACCPDLERMADYVCVARLNVIGFHWELGTPEFVDQSVKDTHVPILEALNRRDSDAAERAARTHVEALLECGRGGEDASLGKTRFIPSRAGRLRHSHWSRAASPREL